MNALPLALGAVGPASGQTSADPTRPVSCELTSVVRTDVGTASLAQTASVQSLLPSVVVEPSDVSPSHTQAVPPQPLLLSSVAEPADVSPPHTQAGPPQPLLSSSVAEPADVAADTPGIHAQAASI